MTIKNNIGLLGLCPLCLSDSVAPATDTLEGAVLDKTFGNVWNVEGQLGAEHLDCLGRNTALDAELAVVVVHFLFRHLGTVLLPEPFSGEHGDGGSRAHHFALGVHCVFGVGEFLIGEEAVETRHGEIEKAGALGLGGEGADEVRNLFLDSFFETYNHPTIKVGVVVEVLDVGDFIARKSELGEVAEGELISEFILSRNGTTPRRDLKITRVGNVLGRKLVDEVAVLFVEVGGGELVPDHLLQRDARDILFSEKMIDHFEERGLARVTVTDENNSLLEHIGTIEIIAKPLLNHGPLLCLEHLIQKRRRERACGSGIVDYWELVCETILGRMREEGFGFAVVYAIAQGNEIERGAREDVAGAHGHARDLAEALVFRGLINERAEDTLNFWINNFIERLEVHTIFVHKHFVLLLADRDNVEFLYNVLREGIGAGDFGFDECLTESGFVHIFPQLLLECSGRGIFRNIYR